MSRGSKDLRLIDIIPAGDSVGEGVLWDQRSQSLWWTDIPRSRLYHYDWQKRHCQLLPAPERVGSFGLVAESNLLITAFASGIAFYDPVSRAVEWLARPTADQPRVRFNDGRVDRRGRFWCGTMMDGQPRLPVGNLYSYDARQGLRSHLSGVLISNSLCMSPDGSLLYFADSPTRTISVHDVQEPDGRLGIARVFARTEAPAVPDGAAIDAEGCLWSAQWGSARVVRYAPDGRVDLSVTVPASQPTCVAFGGPALDLMFVTSAREHLDDAALRDQPHAGDVFVYQTPFRGLPEEEYRT
jgi:L-arabinonolactonase